jgi:hypothetical protein
LIKQPPLSHFTHSLTESLPGQINRGFRAETWFSLARMRNIPWIISGRMLSLTVKVLGYCAMAAGIAVAVMLGVARAAA